MKASKAVLFQKEESDSLSLHISTQIHGFWHLIDKQASLLVADLQPKLGC